MKTLKKFSIIQENDKGQKRFNPKNPFSYVFVLIVFPAYIVAKTIDLIATEIFIHNPFRYQ